MVLTEGRENEFFRFFELTPDLVCIAGRDGYFKNVNPAVIQKLGYSPEEIYSSPISSFIHPDDREITRVRRQELLNGTALTNFYNRYVSKSGDIIWLLWTSFYVPDKEVVFAIAKDVTKKKEHEIEIIENYSKYRNLAMHFKNTLEKEKESLAMELHEELAQLATVIKMDIDWIKQYINGGDAEISERIEHALSVSEFLINSIRKISYSISPHMIRDLGLNESLEWLCGEFSIRNGISFQYFSSADIETLSHEVKLDIYRFCQEVLTNVVDHARATNVEVRADSIEGNISISISDDGQGFDPSAANDSGGFSSIQKRAASVNGKVNIESHPGKGSRISFQVSKQLIAV